MRRSFKSAGRDRVHARSSSGAGGTVGIGSRRSGRSAGTGWRAILWRTRRSGRSAPRLSGSRAGGSERGRRAGSAACERPRKRAWGPIRSPSGIGPSAAGRLVEGDCSRSVGHLQGDVDRVRAARPTPAWVRSMRAVAGCQVRPARARPIQTGLAAFSCRSPPAPEASGALRSGARCAGSFTGARRT